MGPSHKVDIVYFIMASYLPATLVTLKLMLKLTFMYIVGQLLPLRYKRAMAIQEQN